MCANSQVVITLPWRRDCLQMLASREARVAQQVFKRISGNSSSPAAALAGISLNAASHLLLWKEMKLMHFMVHQEGDNKVHYCCDEVDWKPTGYCSDRILAIFLGQCKRPCTNSNPRKFLACVNKYSGFPFILSMVFDFSNSDWCLQGWLQKGGGGHPPHNVADWVGQILAELVNPWLSWTIKNGQR